MSTDWNAKQYQQRHAYVFEYGKAVLDLLSPQKGERILDLGCGSGQLTAAIADAGATVIGLDASPEMLTEARVNYPTLDFRQADAANFTIDPQVDAAFSNAVLHWVKDADGAAASISKALKPNGRFVAEFGGHGNIRSILEALGPIETPWYYPTIGEYASLLERHNLEPRQAWLIDRPTPVEGEDGFEHWLSIFCRDITTPEQRKTLAEKLRATHYKAGIWTLDYRRLRIVAYKREN